MKLASNTKNQNFKFAFVIPCYNEEKRLPIEHFVKFSENNTDVLLFFVNDGSKDNTLGILKQLEISSKNIVAYDLQQNGGKAEAVR